MSTPQCLPPMSTPHILDLPSDCWYSIIPYLSLDDILNLSLLCKSLYGLLNSQEDSLWRAKLSSFLPGLTNDIQVVSGVCKTSLSSSEIKYLCVGVPGALRNLTPESPLGWRYPSITKFNTNKNLCLLLKKIKLIQDTLVDTLLQATSPLRTNQRNSSLSTTEKRFLKEKGIPNQLVDLLKFQENSHLTLPIDYVYFLLNHAHKFWWNPDWLRLSFVPGNGGFVFTGPSCEEFKTRSEFQVITSESLLDHEPEPYLGELVETQYDYWKYVAGERRFLRITGSCGEESERYLMLEVTDFTEADFGSVYYVNNVGDSTQIREFDEEDYMPRTPLWSHFTFTDFLQRFANAHLKVDLVPHRFFYQVGFHEEFKNFLEETEIFDKPQTTFTTHPSCLHITKLPFTLTRKETKLEEKLIKLHSKERKCTCFD